MTSQISGVTTSDGLTIPSSRMPNASCIIIASTVVTDPHRWRSAATLWCAWLERSSSGTALPSNRRDGKCMLEGGQAKQQMATWSVTKELAKGTTHQSQMKQLQTSLTAAVPQELAPFSILISNILKTVSNFVKNSVNNLVICKRRILIKISSVPPFSVNFQLYICFA